jgi:hypothetical protein
MTIELPRRGGIEGGVCDDEPRRGGIEGGLGGLLGLNV